MIVLPACNISDAVKLAEDLFERVRANPIVSSELSIHVTISAGIVQLLQGQGDWKEVLLRVDNALRTAKKNGQRPMGGY